MREQTGTHVSTGGVGTSGVGTDLAMHDTNIAHSYDVLSSLYYIGLRLWTLIAYEDMIV